MWQMVLIPLSMLLLVSTSILLARETGSENNVVIKPRDRLKIIYTGGISPTHRK
jgi:hypothetical protein